MDATIFQIFIGEFGDPNCSLMDAFQDTLYENVSFSLMNFDGTVLGYFITILTNTFVSVHKDITSTDVSFFFLLFIKGLYCNATTDEIGTCWPRSNSGRIVERPCPEYINGVKYNTTSKWTLIIVFLGVVLLTLRLCIGY